MSKQSFNDTLATTVVRAKDYARKLRFYLTPPLKEYNRMSVLRSKNKSIYMVVAFNSAELISVQYESLTKYSAEDFIYVIIDNSTDSAVSRQLLAFARQHKLAYLQLPVNPYTGGNPSASHGIALNYALRRWVSHSAAQYLGILDHDIFLYKKFPLAEVLKSQPFYGLKQEREERWYLWPGYSFFRWNEIKKFHLDFMPVEGLDTGGGNYQSIYRNFVVSPLSFATETKTHLDKKNQNDQKSVSSIDSSWLHLRNGSGWAGEAKLEKKLAYYKKKLKGSSR